MKILFVITTLETGGAEHLMVDLLPRLRNLGCEVELAVFNTSETPYYKELINSGIRIHVFAGLGNVYNPLHILRLMRLMSKYDIVHTHNTSPQLFAAICGCFVRKPILVTTEHSTSNRRRNWKWYVAIDKWMYSRYKRIICISKQAELNLRKHINKLQDDHIMTIFNGVDVNRFVDAEPDLKLVDQYKGLHTSIMVAAFRPQKDFITLIKAYRHLPDDYHLLIVGDGETRTEIEMTIALHNLQDRVHLLGIRNDVPILLKSVDIVVMSSHYEGLSLFNIEGMASGKPFVASDVDGIREITQGYGVLFPHEDDRALSEAILKLTTDDSYREDVVKKCKERALQYDISMMVAKYYELYQRLLQITL